MAVARLQHFSFRKVPTRFKEFTHEFVQQLNDAQRDYVKMPMTFLCIPGITGLANFAPFFSHQGTT